MEWRELQEHIVLTKSLRKSSAKNSQFTLKELYSLIQTLESFEITLTEEQQERVEKIAGISKTDAISTDTP